jgi:hypothetical protein
MAENLYKNTEVHEVLVSDGSKEWWQNGYLHRLDGPAVIKADGTQKWCEDGYLHRIGEPAVIHANGQVEWWLNDKKYPTQKYKDVIIQKATISCNLSTERIATYPFNEIESLVYALEGWKKP